MQVTDELLTRIDHLAELACSDAERERTIRDLEEMIGYVRQISEVDTTGVEPMIQPFFDEELPFRDDVINPDSASIDYMSGNAPELRDGMVVTPRSISRE